MPRAVPPSLWRDYAQSLDQARMQRQHAWNGYRDSASRERRQLQEKYRHQRAVLAALPVSRRAKRRMTQAQTVEGTELNIGTCSIPLYQVP
jgi:hypothetical protein